MRSKETSSPSSRVAVSDQPSSGYAPPSRLGSNAGLAFLVAGVFFMESLDSSVIVTAMPQIAETFKVEPLDVSFGISAYIMALAVFMPVSGWLADRFGSKTTFAAAVLIFTVASLLCAGSVNLPMFVAMRALQGLGGALMVPVGRLVVLQDTPKLELVRAVAILTWPALVAPILGPPVGGLIVTYAHWHWIFLINIPIGLVVFALSLKVVPQLRKRNRPDFDWRGFFCCSFGLMGIVAALQLAGTPHPNWVVLLSLLAVGILLVAISVVHFRRARNPMIELESLRIKTYYIAIFGGSAFRIAISAVPFLLPLMFQLGFGFSALEAGLLVVAIFAGNLTMKPFTTPILRRFGFTPTLVGNGIVVILTISACFLIGPGTPRWLVAAILFLGGMSRSMQFTCLNTIAFADVAEEQMSAANSLFSIVTQISIGMGVAAGTLALKSGEMINTNVGLHLGPGAEYRIAFVIVSILALISITDFCRLDRSAGSDLFPKASRK